MKDGKTLSELAVELERRKNAAMDYVADTRQMEMTSDTAELVVENVNDEQPLPVNDLAHSQIAGRLDIPKKYYEKMRVETPNLLANNVNHWFKSDPHRRMVRTLDGDARAFLSDRYLRISDYDITEAALQAMHEHGEQVYDVVSSEVTEKHMYLQARLPRIEGEVKKGDVVQTGLVVRHSEVGCGSISIVPMIYRLICENGMIAGAQLKEGRMRKTHLGGKILADDGNIAYKDDTRMAMDAALMKQIRDAIHQLSDPALFMKLMEKMRASTEGQKIIQPIPAVEQLTKTLSLPKMESDGILESLIQGQDYSRWGMLNAVTAQANKTESYERAVELESIGGQILDMPQSSWRQIAEAAA